MGKRPAEVELFVGNMGSIQWEDTAFYAKRRIAGHGNGGCGSYAKRNRQPWQQDTDK